MGPVPSETSNLVELKEIISVGATLLATFLGAWFAFRFERSQKKDDEAERQRSAAQRALYTLYNFWNILEQYRKEAIEPWRGKDDAWLNMPATPPIHVGTSGIDDPELMFLLHGDDAMVYANLRIEEQRFVHAVNLVRERSQLLMEVVHPRLGAARIAVGAVSTEPAIEQAIGIDVRHKLGVLSQAVVDNVDKTLASIGPAHDDLRAAMKRRYPKAKFIQIRFEQSAQK